MERSEFSLACANSAVYGFATRIFAIGMTRIAVGQLRSLSSLSRNARVVKKLIRQATEQKAEVLFLPEASDYLSRDAAHSVALASETHNKFLSVIQKELRDINASGSSLQVAIGIHEPTEVPSDRVRNTQVWLNAAGEIVHRYQKIHLFDVNVPNGPILRESKSVEPGNKILDPFPITQGSRIKVGLAICYDIRFGELALRLRKLGASVLTFPSAFTVKTGEAHWLELGKARAIDAQSYVVMAAQCGHHDTNADLKEGEPEGKVKRISYGQLVVIDAWGRVVAQARRYDEVGEADVDEDGDYHELLVADIDQDAVDKIRADISVLDHRRPDVFGYEL